MARRDPARAPSRDRREPYSLATLNQTPRSATSAESIREPRSVNRERHAHPPPAPRAAPSRHPQTLAGTGLQGGPETTPPRGFRREAGCSDFASERWLRTLVVEANFRGESGSLDGERLGMIPAKEGPMRQLIVAFLLAAAAHAQVPQWVQSPLNGHSYALMPAATWAQAEAFAVSVGGHLATIRNANEHSWLAQTFGAAAPPDTRFWIGLTDEVIEGTWAWSSGEPVTYSNWGLWEPDNAGGNQNAGALWLIPGIFGGGWRWCDDQGANGRSSIIEVAQFSPAASYVSFGAGCIGQGGLVPALDGVVGEPPRIGTTTRMRVTNLPPLQVTVPIFALGLSNTVASGGTPYPLPFDLGVLGWTGCDQLVSLDSTTFAITTTGQAEYSLVVPMSSTLPGFVFYAQVLALYHPTGVAVSNGLTGTVGY